MFLKAPLDVCGDASVEVTLLTLDDVDKPRRVLHATIITFMTKITIPFSEFSFSFSRSGGAGGQNVNKVNSKVLLEWNLELSESVSPSVKERFRLKYKTLINESGLVQIMSQKSRSQKMNIDDCIEKLHEMLSSVQFPPKIRRATKPKKSAVLKRLSTKKRDSEKKRLRQNSVD